MTDVVISDSNPIHYQDASTLATLIRTKQLSSREVVQAHLDRVAAVNPKINAVVTLMANQALEDADAADKAVANGAALGPLHGVPFSIKDLLDTAGVPTQRGSKLFAGFIPDKDATSVARFKAAGGIPLMKTNNPEFGAWTESDNLITGRTNNPWNLDRTAGGIDWRRRGGDWCGPLAHWYRQRSRHFGSRPRSVQRHRGPESNAWGGFRYTGHFPTSMQRLWHVGPMARTISDIALAHSILSGPDGIDPYAIHAKDAEPANPRIAGRPIRVGWVSDAVFGPGRPGNHGGAHCCRGSAQGSRV